MKALLRTLKGVSHLILVLGTWMERGAQRSGQHAHIVPMFSQMQVVLPELKDAGTVSGGVEQDAGSSLPPNPWEAC